MAMLGKKNPQQTTKVLDVDGTPGSDRVGTELGVDPAVDEDDRAVHV